MKTYTIQMNIGAAKYVVSHHDGVTKNRDGSPFFGVTIFKNKKMLGLFINGLKKNGYKAG